jgi:hypothetical protein
MTLRSPLARLMLPIAAVLCVGIALLATPALRPQATVGMDDVQMAGETAAGAAATLAEKAEVAVGAYVAQLPLVDLKTNEFKVTFWIWFRWRDDSLDPLETFDLVGGHVDTKENVVRQELPGGVRYAAARISATISSLFNLRRFPLDDHVLTIAIEDGDHDASALRFVADTANAGVDPVVRIPGWSVGEVTARTGTHRYSTNYGDITVPTGNQSTYSRFELRVSADREGLGYFIKLFWGSYLAALIAFLAFFIRPTDLDPRFGLGIGAIFAAAGNAYVISSSLPESPTMTLADAISGVAILYIFFTLIASVVSLHLWTSGRETASRTLDRALLWVLGATFVALNIVLVRL